MLAGDAIEIVASAVGVTPERIEAVTGKPCGCKGRKAAMNKRHVSLITKWYKFRADAMTRLRKLRLRLWSAKNRFVMAWKCLRYGNPHYAVPKKTLLSMPATIALPDDAV